MDATKTKKFTITVETDDIDYIPELPSQLYDFFYGVDDGQIDAEIKVEAA